MEKIQKLVVSINGESYELESGAAASDADALSNKYDLKEGYGYKENKYIAADGTETTLTGKNFKCVDYVPVKVGTSYTMFGVGYALYDAEGTFLSAVIDTTGANAVKQFTPTADGYVRLTINSEDIAYARFCRTSEKDRELCEYEPAPNPFFNPRIPCEVHLYGDSNSYGEGLADKSKSWANRLGVLIEDLPDTVNHYRLSGFAEKAKNSPYMLFPTPNCTASLKAYTSEFTIYAAGTNFLGFYVFIDGQVSLMTADNSESTGSVYYKTYQVAEGYHTLQLVGGNGGTNMLMYVTTKKSRTFTNHAVSGNTSLTLPEMPEGNIDIVLLGGNDRAFPVGITHHYISDFRRKCVAKGIVNYVFTPTPWLLVENGKEPSLAQVIMQLPTDCIDIHKDLQLLELLSGEELYQSDKIHLSEKGHKLLYAIAASKLGLAALNSELV